jgi:hypothetical protein
VRQDFTWLNFNVSQPSLFSLTHVVCCRKIQSVLQKDNVHQYKALHEERRRAEEATERAKEIIKVRTKELVTLLPMRLCDED